jgi:hypothetical protein
MSISTTSHNKLKEPLVLAMFESAPLTDLTGKDSLGNESIYEGWHKPEAVQVNYPYITYRVNWYPTVPRGFLGGTMVVDVWDISPAGNDARRAEEICTVLHLLYDGTILMRGVVVVRCKVTADEWIQDEEPGRIHRQVSVDLHTIDLFSV